MPTPKERSKRGCSEILRQELIRVLRALKEGALGKRWAKSYRAEVELISSQRMRALNFKHRGKNQTTDILSFPVHPAFPQLEQDLKLGRHFLGDLLIAEPILRRQAKEAGHSVREEVQVLLVHGVLHLLGFDHETVPSRKQMLRLERKLLEALGGQAGLIERVSASQM
jgi:rRNA maturation RNase YbeY